MPDHKEHTSVQGMQPPTAQHLHPKRYGMGAGCDAANERKAKSKAPGMKPNLGHPAFADQDGDYVDVELVDFARVQKEAMISPPPIIQMSLPGWARRRWV
jgi:hypothetical protein